MTTTETTEKKSMQALATVLREKHGVNVIHSWEPNKHSRIRSGGITFHADIDDGPRIADIAYGYGYLILELALKWRNNTNKARKFEKREWWMSFPSEYTNYLHSGETQNHTLT